MKNGVFWLLRRVALVRTTRCNNPEDTIIHSHRRENLKSEYHVVICAEQHKLLPDTNRILNISHAIYFSTFC
jgi:hypothetical protein